MREVVVRVKKDGSTTIDMNGFTGKGCDGVKEALLQALQQKVVSDDKKPEYFVEDTVQEELRAGY